MAYHDDCTRNSGGTVSRRTLVAAVATGAGVMALGSRSAVAAEGGTGRAAEHHNQPAARFRSQRSADHLFHGP